MYLVYFFLFRPLFSALRCSERVCFLLLLLLLLLLLFLLLFLLL